MSWIASKYLIHGRVCIGDTFMVTTQQKHIPLVKPAFFLNIVIINSFQLAFSPRYMVSKFQKEMKIVIYQKMAHFIYKCWVKIKTWTGFNGWWIFAGCFIVCVFLLRLTDFSSPGGYSHTLPTRVCAAQRGLDFEAPDLERGIHFRGIF